MRLPTLGIKNLADGSSNLFSNPYTPQLTAVKRCYSTRRIIPAYKKGNAIKTDGDVLVPFNVKGLIDLSGESDILIKEIYDQCSLGAALVGGATTKPKIYDASLGQLNSPLYEGAQFLQHASQDAVIGNILADVTTGASLSFWVYFPNKAPASPMSGFDYRSTDAGKYVYYVYANNMGYSVRSTTSSTIMAASNDTWFHVVYTIKNNDGALNDLNVYVNGVKKINVELPTLPSAASAKLTFGASAVAANFFTGNMNDWMLWAAELSQAEVTALYNAQKTYY